MVYAYFLAVTYYRKGPFVTQNEYQCILKYSTFAMKLRKYSIEYDIL